MQNENYYKAQLEAKIQEFIDEECDAASDDWGWMGDHISKLMTDAAFAVMSAQKDVQNYLINNGELKP